MPQNLSAREILERLVSFPTVSSASNLDLVDWVEAYLAGHGVTATRVYDETGTKASLYANVGPEAPGGVILSGHSDVVPTEGQDWDSDPYVLTERDGRLYGRGACDMKGFDALMLAAVPRALAAGIRRPLQIALSHDEEVGCTGAPAMIDRMRAALPPARAAIIGEPSMMQPVSGHKGSVAIHTHVRGFEVHSSLVHQGVSAVMQAARLIDWANAVNAANAARGPEALDAGFEPPYTTAHVGRVHGGTAENITARDCHFVMAFRVVPSENPQDWIDRYLARVAEVEAEMQAIRPEARIETRAGFSIPGLQPEEAGEAEMLVRRLTGDNAPHKVSYATEAGQFQERGYSAVICGPGNIAQAHQPNEWLALDQLAKGDAFMDRLIRDLAS